jgi:hypothetical protein
MKYLVSPSLPTVLSLSLFFNLRYASSLFGCRGSGTRADASAVVVFVMSMIFDVLADLTLLALVLISGV